MNLRSHWPAGKALLAAALLAQPTISSPAAAPPRVRENFDFGWRFHLGDITQPARPPFDDASWRVLNLPHDFSVEGDFSQTNFSCTGYLPGGIAWYQKTFLVPADWRDKLVSVRFDGVSEKSQVWLNGAPVGGRPWAYTSFTCDLTSRLIAGGANTIAVRVDHSAMDDSRFYVGSGIYRHVWLIATEKTHFRSDGVFVTTPEVSGKSARVEIQTAIENQGEEGEIELTTDLLDPKGRRVGGMQSKQTIGGGPAQMTNVPPDRVMLTGPASLILSQSALVASPKLWSPDSPALYTAVTTLRMGKKTVDTVKTTFGIRSILFDAQRGFLLNGQFAKFRGVCIHHDGGALGAAVPEASLERRLRLLKDIGCNAIRTSHNAPAPELLDLCDRLGFLVMDEAFDEWSGSKHKWLVGWNAGTPSLHGSYSEFFAQWADADLRDMVLRDRNHPCVILWSIGNEVDFPDDPFNDQTAAVLATDGQRLIQAVRQADTTRPITAGLAALRTSNRIGLADALDVVGYNYQLPQPLLDDLAAYPNRKFIGSEDGLEMSYVDLIATNARVTGQFLWVGFDFLGEAGPWPSHGSASGLFDTSGFLKPGGVLRQSLWSEKPMVYMGVRPAPRGGDAGRDRFGGLESHWNWAQDARAQLPVEVYSNCKTVELFLNGKSLGLKNVAEAPDCILRWDAAFQPGELKAVGRRGGKTVEYRLTTAGEPARIALVPDKDQLAADGEDAANIELRLLDAKGVLVPNGNALCAVQVSGAGRLRAVDNGNQTDNTPLTSPSRQLNHGRALAVVQTLPVPGAIEVTVTAPGLPAAHLTLRSR
ncbi:MAG: glycoside hydrolase family 2 TIM barrel-domain containing protein [Verrucomicrobiota bacterium]|jgi:hypothetical protein